MIRIQSFKNANDHTSTKTIPQHKKYNNAPHHFHKNWSAEAAIHLQTNDRFTWPVHAESTLHKWKEGVKCNTVQAIPKTDQSNLYGGKVVCIFLSFYSPSHTVLSHRGFWIRCHHFSLHLVMATSGKTWCSMHDMHPSFVVPFVSQLGAPRSNKDVVPFVQNMLFAMMWLWRRCSWVRWVYCRTGWKNGQKDPVRWTHLHLTARTFEQRSRKWWEDLSSFSPASIWWIQLLEGGESSLIKTHPHGESLMYVIAKIIETLSLSSWDCLGPQLHKSFMAMHWLLLYIHCWKDSKGTQASKLGWWCNSLQ